ncbi:sensor histidine kinase [Gordonia soli]|uniref:histidine kinase n=1 Tax=Gordonia soli NBRC 108243 TaxID=1223545 RepID=M0QL83_9ACTN|nr:sensor histidine kinase [Gordonia soli]GAC69061.1 putative two-component histidine kinase [Gordonia soli NBRC 108243]
MRPVPRTLAGQAVALALTVVAAIVVAGSVLAAVDARVDGDRAARNEVTAVAVSLADAPSTIAAVTSPDPAAVLQPVTEQVRATTGIAFITIMAPDRTRFTHTDPTLIGKPYIGNVDTALRGQVFTETYTGTLGPSIRTVAPVRAADGRVVGLVAAGITQRSLSDGWWSQLPLIAAIAAAALGTALLGLWFLRRRLIRQTGGLAPDELRVMYEHHDAVLHAVREGLIVTEAGRAVMINDEARRLLALDASDRSSDDDRRTDHAALPEFVTDGSDTIDDTLYAVHGRILVVNRSPVPDRPRSAVVTIRDRTELSAAMGELDSMTRFAETLRSQAHETANRLHTIVGLVEMGRGDDAVRLATTELELSQHLVDRMTQAVSEPTLVALLLGKTAQAVERGVSLSLTEDSQMNDAATHGLTPGEVITVVGNLIDNAMDACDPTDPWVEVTVVGHPGELRIVVADSGPGMDRELFTRALERGWSTKGGGDRSGRGLGLALVAQVVARHGGTLTAENSYGSVITVTVPAPDTRQGSPR